MVCPDCKKTMVTHCKHPECGWVVCMRCDIVADKKRMLRRSPKKKTA